MRKIAVNVLAFAFAYFIGGVLFVFGQDRDGERWVQIVDAEGLLTFSVPSDYLVDKDSDLDYRVVAFDRGVTFEVQADRISGAGSVFKNLNPRSDESGVEFEFASNSNKKKPAKVKRFVSNDSLSYRIFLSSGARYYRVLISSISAGEPALQRFLESILVNGNPLQEGKAPLMAPLETRPAKELKTSQEVTDARSKRQPKRIDTYTYFAIDAFKPITSTTDPETRRAIVVDRSFPVLLAFAPGQHKVKVVAELLANGLVGKLVIYSNLQEKMIPHIIESALGIKFVPAKKGSKYVDSIQVIDYSVNVGEPVIHRNTSIPPPNRGRRFFN